MKLTAVILTGGKSSRMGRNKTVLPWKGLPLWKHQWKLLTSLSLAELIISGPQPDSVAPPDLIAIPDEFPESGPLGGIHAALKHTSHDGILVLGVDMPLMTSTFLQNLIRQSSPQIGCIPLLHGQYEPLAAIYPKACLEVAETHLKDRQRSLQKFTAELIQNHLMSPIRVSPKEEGLFFNLNTPDDLMKLGQSQDK